MPSDTPLQAYVEVVGLVQGQEVQARALLSLEPPTLTFAWETGAPWMLAFDGLDGVRIAERTGTLYLAGHDLLELHGDTALRPLLRALGDALCQVPELLRSVRYFGAIGASADLQAAHDCWFAPILSARRALVGVSDPLRQVALCEAATLEIALRHACDAIAAQTEAAGGARQRARSAQLEALAEPAFQALASLALAADALRRRDEDTRFADWRRWISALREVVRALEDGWVEVAARLP